MLFESFQTPDENSFCGDTCLTCPRSIQKNEVLYYYENTNVF